MKDLFNRWTLLHAIITMTQIVFFTLKLFNVISWDWVWVLSPLWLYSMAMLTFMWVCAAVSIFLGIIALTLLAFDKTLTGNKESTE